MLRTIVFFLVVFLLAAGCKKSTSASTFTVEYQVTTTNSSSIAINYNNAIGDSILTNASGSWIYDLPGLQKPFKARIQASSNSPFSSIQTTCTVNILVNGGLVKTATVSSNTIAVAEADYTVQ